MKIKFQVICSLLLIPFLVGFSANITEIQTALIKEDYKKVERLALDGLKDANEKTTRHQLDYYLGLSCLRLGKFSQARESFQRIISEGVSKDMQDLVYLGLFDSQYLSENYDWALATIQKILKISPKSESLSLIYLKYARVNLKLTNWQEARDYLERIRKEFPQSLEASTARQLLEEKYFFAVQVGSFIEAARAEQLVNELKQKGEYAYIVETIDAQNNKYFRVRVGRLNTLDDAQKLRSQLTQKGYPAHIYP